MLNNSKLHKLIEEPHLISQLQFSDIAEILKKAREILLEEFLLMHINLHNSKEMIYVIGDLHGNLESLMRLIEIINKTNPKYVLFLGDLVDRGENQLECLILVLILKILNPNQYYVLKGNHETVEMNQVYGFYYEFLEKFKDPKRFYEVLSLYQVIPICFIINKTILCLHGGIPEDFDALNKFEGLRVNEINERVYKTIANSIYQILWNDPKEVENLYFSNSFRGPGIKFFGKKAFDNFMKINNLKYLIRAHECFEEGYRWFFNKRLLSIFSSANYRGYFSPNSASYAIIQTNMIFPKILKAL